MGAARKSISAALLAIAPALLVAPAPSLATPLVPPGNSAVNQYTESLPGAGGNESTRDIAGKPGRTPKKVLGASNAAKLEELGSEGRAAAALAAKSAPAPGAEQTSQGKRLPGGKGRSSEPGGAGPVGQILGQVTGSSGSEGMGWLLPALLVLSAAAAAGFALARRRAKPQA